MIINLFATFLNLNQVLQIIQMSLNMCQDFLFLKINTCL